MKLNFILMINLNEMIFLDKHSSDFIVNITKLDILFDLSDCALQETGTAIQAMSMITVRTLK